MGKVIFARTRHVYDSYADFWSLVRLSEFPTVYVDEIDFQSNNLYITAPMNGDYRAHLANHYHDRRCKLAQWLLERPTPEHGESLPMSITHYWNANKELEAMRYVDFTIVSDPLLSKLTGFLYVPMGSHIGLGAPGRRKEYDFIGLMAPYHRRSWLFDGDKVKPVLNGMRLAPNANPITETALRHQLLQQSRFGLNVHNDEHPFCEPLRFALFAAYSLPVVTESIPDGTIYHDAVCQADYHNLQNAMGVAYKRYALWRQWGEQMHHVMTGEKSFRRCLERRL